MKKTISMMLVLAMLAMAAGALAAGVSYSGRAKAGLIADGALEARYGITRAMQTYFLRSVDEGKTGTVMRYKPLDEFSYVLGAYTVTVKDGKATAVWSWDGEPTSEGFDKAPWGAKQLQEMIETSRETLDYSAYYHQAIALADAAGVTQPAPHIPTEAEAKEIAKARAATRAIVEAQWKLSPDELSAIGQAAIMEIYGVTDAMLPYLTRVAQNDSWGVDEGDRGLWALAFAFGNGEEGFVGDVHPEWLEWIGNYVVTINVETGVVESLLYDSLLAGNG